MTAQRKPRAFVLTPGRNRPSIEFTAGPAGPPVVTVPPTAPLRVRRKSHWLKLLVASVSALMVLGMGLSIDHMVEALFARNVLLGWIATAFAGLAAFATVAIVIREIKGLLRLRSIENLQDMAVRAINLDDAVATRQAVMEMTSLYRKRTELMPGLSRLHSHEQDIMDPRDRMRLVERLLLEPLDEIARKLVASRARRVALLTTVTPAAALDVLFVAAVNFAMLRDIANLYGGRPATLATIRLARMVTTQLAVTGGLALSDNLLQHLIGRGLLGRISARFGEGAVNGILTARIGLAAITACRPIPSDSPTSQSLASFIREVFTFARDEEKDADQKSQS